MFNKFDTTEVIGAVKKVLDEKYTNIDFYVVGPSAFQAVQGNESKSIEDIRVYFYKKEDFVKVKTYFASLLVNVLDDTFFMKDDFVRAETNNHHFDSILFMGDFFGTPSDLFKTFDLNTSKVAITNNFDIIKDPSFDNCITVDFTNFNTQTFVKYLRYVKRKNAVDPQYREYKKLIDFTLENLDVAIFDINEDINEDNKNGLDILKTAMYYASIDEQQIAHDLICERFEPQERIRIFEFLFITLSSDIHNICDELLIFDILYRQSTSSYIQTQKDKHVMLKYAEYFI